jgi:glycosyltransferase involved in cell wall biosynthesis
MPMMPTPHRTRPDPGDPGRVRIALIMQDFAGGGAEKVMVSLAAGLAARGHRVEIVAVRAEGPCLSRVPPGVPVVTLGPTRVSRSIPALARYLRERQPEAALSSLVHVNVAAVLARGLARGTTRLVLREENRISQNMGADRPRLIRLAYRLLPWTYPRADHVIAVSRGLAEEVRAITQLPAARVSAVYNPVLTEQDLDGLESMVPAIHAWLEDEGVPVVLSVGRLVPQKDHVTLLEAFARLRSERAVRLVVLGEGPLRDELVERAQRLGIMDDVLFAGFTDQPFAWMKGASVLAHTARWEGFGNVIVEALASGLPVVATDCPSGPSEILEGGRFGRLVPVGDVNAVANALAATLDAPPDPGALRRRAAEFTVEAIVPRYEEILLGRNR